MTTLFRGGAVFDGHRYLPDHALLVDDGSVSTIGPEGALGLDAQDLADAEVVDLAGGLVSPGLHRRPRATRSRAASSGCAAT